MSRRTLLPIAAALLLSAGAAPLHAAARTPGLDRLEEVRSAVSEGGLTGLLRGAALLEGVAPAAVASAPAPAVPSLPPALARPVGRLAAAVDAAGRAAAEAVPAGLDAAALSAESRAELDLLGLDRPLLLGAADLLARTIEQTLPDLRAAAARPAPGVARAACDQVDQPNVCVGGPGANTFTQDVALLIDLGGDDVYANSAGGADRVGNGLPVSVAIDLGGNDRYETTTPTASGANLAQGAAASGIGILVDSSGNDTYAVSTTRNTIAGRGQGTASLGVGLLADLEGNDSYRVTYAPTQASTQRALGQAHAGVGGVGILLDRQGSDAYLLESTPGASLNANGDVVSGSAVVQGLGFAEVGTALLVDGGGADAMTLSGAADDVPATERRAIAARAAVAVEGFGFATLGGSAVVLSGQGDTNRAATALASGPWTGGSSVSAFGVGTQGGYAALHDAGGADTYRMDARGLARAVADAGCECSEAVANADALAVGARGAGYAGAGVGILQDLAGNDRYLLTALAEARATARDDRAELPPDDPGVGARAFATAGNSDATAMGYGSVGGFGLLEDLAGADEYRADVASTADANASAANEASTTIGAATGGRATSWVQAVGNTAGYGELRDEGGADTYSSTARSETSAVPPTDVIPGEVRSGIQGSVELQQINGADHPAGGAALLMDRDGGAADTFTATPPDPACVGTRGQGLWRDCGPSAGFGRTD